MKHNRCGVTFITNMDYLQDKMNTNDSEMSGPLKNKAYIIVNNSMSLFVIEKKHQFLSISKMFFRHLLSLRICFPNLGIVSYNSLNWSIIMDINGHCRSYNQSKSTSTFCNGNTLSLKALWCCTSWQRSTWKGCVCKHDNAHMHFWNISLPSVCVCLILVSVIAFCFGSDSFNISPTLCTVMAPPSLCVSLSVSDRVCYTSSLPTGLMPTSPSSGDVVSSPLSPRNRWVRSPPRGAGAGRQGEEWEETSRFFFSPPSLLKSESSKNVCTGTHIGTLWQTLTLKFLHACLREADHFMKTISLRRLVLE